MTATFAPGPWPAPGAPVRDDGWQFARLLEAPRAWHFELKGAVSVTPRRLLAAYLVACGVSVTVALGFWLQGVAMVMAFTVLELAALAAALWWVARHAGDREVLTLTAYHLAVEQWVGPEVQRTRFRTEWLRVEPAADGGSLVELSGEGRRVRVGRHLRPELRPALAKEIRRALRLARAIEHRTEDQDRRA